MASVNQINPLEEIKIKSLKKDRKNEQKARVNRVLFGPEREHTGTQYLLQRHENVLDEIQTQIHKGPIDGKNTAETASNLL